MKLSHAVFLLICFSFATQTTGQNLILNPGFENRNPNVSGCQACTLPNGFSQVSGVTTCTPDADDVMDWWDNGGTCDFYFRGGTGGAAVPMGTGNDFFSDAATPQDVRTGDAAGGFIVHRAGGSNPHQREYLIAKLSTPLTVGQQYAVEFYALLSNNSTFSTDDIGAYFSDGVINNLAPPPSENALQIYDPSINFDAQASAAVSDVVNWTQICGVFTATTPATHVYIGNVNSFPNTSLTARAQTGSSSWDGAYYYIDDVRVESWNGTATDFCTTSLPAELTDFTGTAQEGKNILSWKTATEFEHDYFVVERQVGKVFSELERLPGKGATGGWADYSFEHQNPLATEIYRLKMVDTDGGFTYSKSIAIKASSTELTQFSLFPNPTTDKLYLNVVSREDQTLFLEYSDWTGSIKLMNTVEVSEDLGNVYEMEGFRELAVGLYYVRALNGKGEVLGYHKVMKQ